jgi:two-component system phosphate regulon sensor histidine kinase PhoR
MRRDFVANVSHELRTPITSIQGFVETLREGAARDPAMAERFLGIVARQAERLGAIIDDLLCLSRIEQEAEKSQVEMTEVKVAPVLAAAAADTEALAGRHRIRIEVVCPEELSARMNAPLIEQAVGNLLNNAVKYSPAGSRVVVEATRDDGGVAIIVRDTGCGIPGDHLPRIFERFYRVDKARSRKLGGTGLGLAIVKHIAQAHGGSVTVESTVGQGSTFTLHLPLTSL